MILRRCGGLSVAAALCALIWYGYGELTLLRQTVWWDLRYVIFAVAVFVLLSVAQRVWTLAANRLVKSNRARLEPSDHG